MSAALLEYSNSMSMKDSKETWCRMHTHASNADNYYMATCGKSHNSLKRFYEPSHWWLNTQDMLSSVASSFSSCSRPLSSTFFMRPPKTEPYFVFISLIWSCTSPEEFLDLTLFASCSWSYRFSCIVPESDPPRFDLDVSLLEAIDWLSNDVLCAILACSFTLAISSFFASITTAC